MTGTDRRKKSDDGYGNGKNREIYDVKYTEKILPVLRPMVCRDIGRYKFKIGRNLPSAESSEAAEKVTVIESTN